MGNKRTRQIQTNSNEFYTLLIKKLNSKAITLESILQFEQKSVFTKGMIAQRFEIYVQDEEHLYRTDKHGKKVALSSRYIFQKFANHYVNEIIQALGLEVNPLKQTRTYSKVERLMQLIRPSSLETEEELQL